MLGEDIKIGEGTVGSCWTKVDGYKGSYWIASNILSYSINDGPLGIRFYLKKDTDEGNLLVTMLSRIQELSKKMIRYPVTEDDEGEGLNEEERGEVAHEYDTLCLKVDLHLTQSLMRHIPIASFLKHIEDLKAQAKQEGKDELREAFRKLLGVSSGY